MEPQPTRPAADASRDKVPDELVNQLHDANAHFHSAKQQMEQAMDDPEFNQQSRVESNTEKLRDAEREVEEVTRKIHKATGWPSTAEGDPGTNA
ncbi:MAG: hypothetical protein JWO87_3193 [Phycisphaerales bacterium]|nr:hypothetical protein [Phycisphaerales bacterium]MDB5301530.1 hypothetical protein [Phycisphaerales bacterium]